jgi:hypothetical protein
VLKSHIRRGEGHVEKVRRRIDECVEERVRIWREPLQELIKDS